MPWNVAVLPSIQLGTLKSYLESKGNYKVDNIYAYLMLFEKIGRDLYYKCVESDLFSELFFSDILFNRDSSNILNKVAQLTKYAIQEGLTEPVALLLDEEEDLHNIVQLAGFRFFTSQEAFYRYVEGEILELDLAEAK